VHRAKILSLVQRVSRTAPSRADRKVTDPNLVYDLRAKLDASGHYDEFEVDRVVARVALYQNGVSGSPSCSE
jgi:type I restriction enzyme R subunit